MRIKRMLAAAAAAAMVVVPVTAGVAGADEPDATITAVHGIPGTDLGLDDIDLPVDVLINGELCAITDFRFGDVSDRLSVPAGTYDVEIKLSDGECGGDTALSLEDVDVPAGANASIVAHLDAEGDPTASVFVNDLSRLGLWQSRVAVHHTAAAPAVDVDLSYVNWSHPFVSVRDLVNGEQAVAETWVGFYKAEISPAGGEPIFEAGPLTLWGNRLYNVYAVGSVASGTFTLILDVQLTEGASH